MEIIAELRILGSALRYFFLLFVALAWGFFSLGTPSLPEFLFSRASRDLVPAGVTIIGVSPLSAITVEMKIAAFLALLTLLPVVVLWGIGYFSPALREREKKAVRGIVIPSFLLFVAGMIFGYFFVLPETFAKLYAHAPLLGIESYFHAEQFISTVALFLVVMGTLFLIPVVMPVLTYLGIVPQKAWVSGWRIATIVTLIGSAILTADGSGVTMMLFSAPTISSYIVGMGISSIVRRV